METLQAEEEVIASEVESTEEVKGISTADVVSTELVEINGDEKLQVTYADDSVEFINF